MIFFHGLTLLKFQTGLPRSWKLLVGREQVHSKGRAPYSHTGFYCRALLCFARGKAARFETMQIAHRQRRPGAVAGAAPELGLIQELLRGWGCSGAGAGAAPGAVGFPFAARRQNSKNAPHFKSKDAAENNEEGGGSRGSWAVLAAAPSPEQADGAGSDLPAQTERPQHSGICSLFFLPPFPLN